MDPAAPVYHALARRLAVVALLMAALAGQAWANPQATLQVSARVMPYTRVASQSSPATLVVTAADVERGYVDAESPLAFSIVSNSGHGATLVFAPLSPHVEQASVAGLPRPVQVGRSQQSIYLPMPGSGMSRLALSLRFRFYLAAGTPAGVHPWPVRVSTEVL